MIERHASEVERVLLHLGDARTRASRAAATLTKDGAEPHIVAAVTDAADGLGDLHRTLMQATYYAIPKSAPKAP